MPILQQRDQQEVRQRFDLELKTDVNITLFTQRNVGGLFIPGRECESCGPNQQMLEELSALSSKIHLETVDFYSNQEDARSRRIQFIPATIVSSNSSDNVRFFGLPSGFEFAVLLDTIVAASKKQPQLEIETRRRLRKLSADVHIQVFVTPNCQYCPTVAKLAHAMAMESPRVVADVVEVQEFPQLASAYGVRGVPKTVINDAVQFSGAVSEEVFLKRLLQAVGEEESDDEDAEVSEETTPIA